MEQTDNKLTTKKFFTEKIYVEKTRFVMIMELIEQALLLTFLTAWAVLIFI